MTDELFTPPTNNRAPEKYRIASPIEQHQYLCAGAQSKEAFAYRMKEQRERIVKLLMREIGKTLPDAENELDQTDDQRDARNKETI